MLVTNRWIVWIILSMAVVGIREQAKERVKQVTNLFAPSFLTQNGLYVGFAIANKYNKELDIGYPTNVSELWKAEEVLNHHYDSIMKHVASAGNLEGLKYLLKLGFPVNGPETDDYDMSWTPLNYAVACGHSECAKLLLDNGGTVRRGWRTNVNPDIPEFDNIIERCKTRDRFRNLVKKMFFNKTMNKYVGEDVSLTITGYV